MIKIGIFMPYMQDIDSLFDRVKKEAGYKGKTTLIKPKNELEKKKAIPEVDIVISGPLTSEEIIEAKKLKLIQVPYAGTEEFNLNLLKERSILLSNVHGNATSVAEHAFSLLLALAKGVVTNDKDLRKGMWHGWMSKEPNIEIEGKTLCIIGLGSTGKKAAQFGKAFGMNIVGVKKNITSVPNVDKVYGIDKIKDAVSKADFIIIAVPATNETKGLIGKEMLELMRGKYLINVSRGSVINERDLFVALKNHTLKGSAIDTWWLYPESQYKFQYPSRYPFWLLDNIIMSPHTAGYSDKSIGKNWEEAIINVILFASGKKIKNIVSIEKGY
jgi:phosphoglycerate dehydrogenase-like enzyme